MDTVREALDTANMWWRVPASTEVDTMLNTVVSQYMSGQIELEEAVQKMDEGIETALKNAPPEEGTKNYNLKNKSNGDIPYKEQDCLKNRQSC